MPSDHGHAEDAVARNAPGLPSPARSPGRETHKPLYERPVILSHSGEEILEELGPAQACYPFNSCGITP